MTETERRPPKEAPPTTTTRSTPIVTPGTDLVLTRHARRLRLHHVLVRRRRWMNALDDLIAVDPWDFSEPIDWSLTATTFGERERAGRDLAAAGWCP